VPEPTPAELWLEAVERAGGLTALAVRDLYHRMLDDDVDEPEQRQLWGDVGRRLGVGPPPEDLFDREPDAPELAAGPTPTRWEYRHERR
jgi:hypothetical protein